MLLPISRWVWNHKYGCNLHSTKYTVNRDGRCVWHVRQPDSVEWASVYRQEKYTHSLKSKETRRDMPHVYKHTKLV